MVGIDVGGTKILGIVLDGAAQVVGECRRPTPLGGTDLVAVLIAMVQELRRGVPGVTTVGIGLPGLVDRHGLLCRSPHLGGVVDLDVAVPLGTATGLEVVVDNDATCALVAEHRLGAARLALDVLLVTLGTGIGGGLLLGGRVYRGTNGFAGEVGHMIVEPQGRPCPCGSRGCWERYASGQALGLLMSNAGAEPGAEPTDEVLDTLAGWVALGLVNLVHLLDVEQVVVAGGLVALGERLLGPVRDAVEAQTRSRRPSPAVTVVAAALGPRAGAVGAALLARDQMENDRDGPGGAG